MKLLLINSGFGTENDKNRILPLTMYHIGGVLRANGHLIDIIDPDICGHSEDNYHNLMDNIKHICGEKDAVVI